VSFLDPAFLVPGKLMEYSAQGPPDLPKQHLLADFGVNTTWSFNSHVAWFK